MHAHCADSFRAGKSDVILHAYRAPAYCAGIVRSTIVIWAVTINNAKIRLYDNSTLDFHKKKPCILVLYNSVYYLSNIIHINNCETLINENTKLLPT